MYVGKLHNRWKQGHFTYTTVEAVLMLEQMTRLKNIMKQSPSICRSGWVGTEKFYLTLEKSIYVSKMRQMVIQAEHDKQSTTVPFHSHVATRHNSKTAVSSKVPAAAKQ